MTRLHFFAGLATAALAIAGCSDNNSGDAPPDHAQARTTQLVQYATCSDLEADLKQMVIREMWADIDELGSEHWGYGEAGGAGTPTDGTSSGNGSGGRQEGVDYSGTNDQVAGVDEADFVKTDGYFVYVLNGNRLHIFGVPNFGDLVPESVMQLEGHPFEMLMDATANRIVAFSEIDVAQLPDGHPLKQLVGYTDQNDGNWYWRSPMVSKITVIDITDRTAPKLVREVYQEGWYETARKVDSSVRAVAYSEIQPSVWYNWYQLYQQAHQDPDATKELIAQRVDALHLADLIPALYIRTPDGQFTTNSLSQASCQSFYRPTDSHARGITSILSLDLLGDSFNWDADHVVSNWPTIYSSLDTMIVAEPAHDWWWYWWFSADDDQLNIHAFDISTPGQTTYLASGRVDGHIIDQFSLDETNGYIRVATATGDWERWWTNTPPNPENHVDVLQPQGNQLVQVGALDNLSPGDALTASRFMGNQAYLTTYQWVDPLLTIDLTDPTAPKLAGSLQVPGYSTYLQAMGDHDVMSIGIDNSNNNWTTQLSLFDVSNFSQPAVASQLPISLDSGWSWSQALWDHKAFNYWAPQKLLAVPESNWTYNNATNSYQYLSKLMLVNADPTTGLSLHGTIDHSAYYNNDDGWWVNTDISRSIFMGDYVYAISDKAITAHRTADLGQVNAQTLPGYVEGDWWWWW